MSRKYNKYNLEIIKNKFEDEGYMLISDEYKNPHVKLKYICPNGHRHSISFGKWLYGRRCPYCSKKIKYKINYIRENFEKEDYILLSKKYENVFSKLKYKCNKGHIGTITWHNWKINNARCLKCKHENMLLDKNPNWKGGISCEPYCQDWTKEFKDYIKERDGHICLNPDCWGNITRLSVHHIDYNKKNCEPQNLITLCSSCNSRANFDRKWHESWYRAIILKRYCYSGDI